MNTQVQSFSLTDPQELILHLIQQELRTTKFTNALGQLGFDLSVFGSDLGVVILDLAGFTERSDELWIWYYERLDVYADQIDLQDRKYDDEVAWKFWEELRGRVEK